MESAGGNRQHREVEIFVARQPIFDRNSQVRGYELLYRSAATADCFDGDNEDRATLDVLAGSLLTIGLSSIAAGKPAFINFGRNLLMDGVASLVPRESVIIEVLETVEPEEHLIATCRKLRTLGYTVALDDYQGGPGFEELTAVADIIKVDLRLTSRAEQERLIAMHHPRGITMLAEKVETREEFEWAVQAGYELFQGYFFARPEVVAGREIQPRILACLQLLRQLQSPETDFRKLEELISKDVSLTHRLFRFANSGLFGRQLTIKSIRHALIMLGEENIRRWVTIATLRRVAGDKPEELVACALVRARFSETLARLAGEPAYPSAYLIGLLSLLDALLDQPLEKALGELGLADPITDVLTGAAGEDQILMRAYRLVRSYEVGDWGAVETLAGQLGLGASDVSNAYAASTQWATEVLCDRPQGSAETEAAAQPARRKERRRRPRYTLSGPVKVRWGSNAGEEHLGQVTFVEISQFGARFRVLSQVPSGAWLTFNIAELEIGGRGTVQYCRSVKGAYEIGVEFPGGTGWEAPSQRLNGKIRGLNAAIDRLQPTA